MSFNKAQARIWLNAGEVENALTYMNQYADAGSIDALVSLADYYFDVGNVTRSAQCIERAENHLLADDWDGHVALASAYRLGLGTGDPQSLQRRALAHLEQVGEAGNPIVQESLMMHYLEGLNGAPCDSAKAMYWATKAAMTGSQLAKDELKKRFSGL